LVGVGNRHPAPSPSSALPPPAHAPVAAPTCISGRTSYLRVRLAFHPYPQVIPLFCNTGGCGPRRGVTPASPCPWIAHPVSGRIRATARPVQTRFRSGSTALAPLNLPGPATPGPAAPMHSSDHSTKGTPSPRSGRTAPAGLRLLVGAGFQVLVSSPSRGAFHLSLTVLVPYRWPVVLRLGGWSPPLPTG
jgi:hypothetical protein